MMETKISIIMPSLNVAGYIRQCLESVLSQTLSDIEILCIDAGSDDGTLDIIREYASMDNRIQVIHSERKSYGCQMNLGISVARGDYIGIVETDDYINRDMYEELYSSAIKEKADVVKALHYEIYEYNNNRKWIRESNYIPREIPKGTGVSPSDYPQLHYYDVGVWNGIYCRKFLLRNHIAFNESPGAAFQDIGFMHQVINNASTVVFLEDYYYNYRVVRAGSSSGSVACAENTCTEYKRLFDNHMIKEERLNYVYGKMISSFLREYDRALKYCGFDMDRMTCSESFLWMRQEIDRIITTSMIAVDVLSDKDRKHLLMFLDQNDYVVRRKRMYEALIRFTESFRTRGLEKGLIVFGCGRFAEDVIPFLLKNDFFPKCLTDNNKALWEKDMFAIKIMPPEKCIRLYPNAEYLIINKHYGSVIRDQLIDMGIAANQIVQYDGRDPVLRDAILEQPVLTSSAINETEPVGSR